MQFDQLKRREFVTLLGGGGGAGARAPPPPRGSLINKDLRRETLPLTPTLSPLRGEREQTESAAR
jgi:hypothetical protein